MDETSDFDDTWYVMNECFNIISNQYSMYVTCDPYSMTVTQYLGYGNVYCQQVADYGGFDCLQDTTTPNLYYRHKLIYCPFNITAAPTSSTTTAVPISNSTNTTTTVTTLSPNTLPLFENSNQCKYMVDVQNMNVYPLDICLTNNQFGVTTFQMYQCVNGNVVLEVM